MFPQIIRSGTFFGERGDTLLTRGEEMVHPSKSLLSYWGGVRELATVKKRATGSDNSRKFTLMFSGVLRGWVLSNGGIV